MSKQDQPLPPPPPGDDPPPYQPSSSTSAAPPSHQDAGSTNDPDELVQPIVLGIAGRSILAEQPGAAPGSAPPTAMYSLSRALADLGDYDQSVALERLDYKVRTAADGTPRVAPPRGKHVYDLCHPPPVTAPRFAYELRSQSRQTLGSLGMVRTSLAHVKEHHLKSGWRAVRKDNGFAEFDVVRKDRRRLEWRDSFGTVVAIEEEDEEVPLGDIGPSGTGAKVGENVGRLRMVMMVPLPRRLLDALVGVWCVRAWQEGVERAYKPQGFSGC
ncbi:uncharacterized protein E0L32_009961 [Thyridium curvatum]|uniref:Uncharacterized protein n=1 Tax=Thyridium curvatum TaxID=1093900 RepID=A0A507AHR1_9PEZI|nr:uncharacterized protein E0L32_009961 [Thyridium curvatum]TPX08622.1 hypothetical protein E0L32_009961 [Thyridium curvatum]